MATVPLSSAFDTENFWAAWEETTVTPSSTLYKLKSLLTV